MPSRTIAKRIRRYSDLYHAAFISRTTTGDSMREFVHRVLRDFSRAPHAQVRVPRYVHTLITSQSIAEGVRDVVVPTKSWALMQFIEKRAARLIKARALEFLYRPTGWFVRVGHSRFVRDFARLAVAA